MSKLGTWNPLDSSFIKQYKYNGADLIVEFKDGKMFKYGNVPWRKVKGLAVASSAGAYFKKEIADAHPFEVVEKKAKGNSHDTHTDVGSF